MASAVARAGGAADRSPTRSLERPAIGLKQSDRDDGDGVQGGNTHDDESRIGDDGQPARDNVSGREDPATGVRRVLRLARSPTTAAPRRIRTKAPQLAVVKRSNARDDHRTIAKVGRFGAGDVILNDDGARRRRARFGAEG